MRNKIMIRENGINRVTITNVDFPMPRVGEYVSYGVDGNHFHLAQVTRITHAYSINPQYVSIFIDCTRVG